MSNTVEIPAEAVAAVQEALFVLMSEAAEGLSQALRAPDRECNPDWFVDDRRRLERAWGLLDEIGWDVDVVSGPVEVDLGGYGGELREAIKSYLPLLEGQAGEAEANDRWRIEHGKPPKKEEIVRQVALLGELSVTLDREVRGGSD